MQYSMMPMPTSLIPPMAQTLHAEVPRSEPEAEEDAMVVGTVAVEESTEIEPVLASGARDAGAAKAGDLGRSTLRQLRALCKNKGLPVKGRKEDLVQRLAGWPSESECIRP